VEYVICHEEWGHVEVAELDGTGVVQAVYAMDCRDAALRFLDLKNCASEQLRGRPPRMSDTQITPDGLRYVKKAPASNIITPCPDMMSCFKCGRFVLRMNMTSKRFFGKYHRVCTPKCA